MNLAVIILSKCVENLTPCLAAVRRHEPTAEIIVVDDGLVTRPEVAGVRYIAGEKPFVYSRNVNIGIDEAFRRDKIDVTTHSSGGPVFLPGNVAGVVLLNDDAVLESPRGFSLLAAAAAADPRLGLVGGTTNVTGNLNQHAKGVGLRDEPRMLTFLCVYIPRATLELCGGLDERFVGYGCDDDDYSFTVRAKGLKLAVHDGCFVDHGSLRSSFRGDPRQAADFRPNLKRFIEKWGCDNWGRPTK
jgi:GT2 family glycosyltransferase